MPLSAGDKLGPYEVLSPLGAGGMGEVYKARDTRLDRTVAVKVLPEHIAQRDDSLARFEREARAVASLNHPNICTLHDIGPGYMVMELIDGETLANRIEKGPLPLEQLLKAATQIADALDRAHRAGVTHRDIKPHNIMLTRDGVKVLDFGLAKSSSKPGPTEATLTKVLTTEGTVMGTPQYMAPEQFEGREADTRGDIWAFGAVLYEMATGQKAFQGKSYSSLVGAILSAEPPPMAVQPLTPKWLERLVRRCLAKDPEDRWQTMRDVVIELQSPPPESIAAAGPASKTPRWPWIAAVALPTLIAAALALVHFREKPVTAPLLRSTLLIPKDLDVSGVAGAMAVSPDEKHVVWAGRNSEGKVQLWLRPLDGITAQPLAGTEGARDPFWSPDGKSIGFYADRKLKRIDAAGGPVLSLTDADMTNDSRGASWSSTGVIVFTGNFGQLKRVSASGGTVTDATKLEAGDSTNRRPSFLPDGVHFLYAAGDLDSTDSKVIRLGSLGGPESTKLIDATDSGAIYSAGYLLFLRRNVLMAQAFDARRLALSGDAFPVVENVPGGGPATMAGFSASPQGLLLHGTGSRYTSDLTWLDRKGNRTIVPGEPATFVSTELSRDSSLLAVAINETTSVLNMWLVDLARGLRTRFTTQGNSQNALFSPDGRTVFFSSERKEQPGLYRKPVDGGRAEELVYQGSVRRLRGISPDGKFLLYSSPQGTWALPDPLGEPGKSKPFPLPQIPREAVSSQLSPEGRWIAYDSGESGRREVYVVPFPEPGAKRQISSAGGGRPRWRADGKELFYLTLDGQLAAVNVAARGGTLESGEPQLLFSLRMLLAGSPDYTYDVSADGQRILAAIPRSSSDGLTIVQNWPALLKK